MRVTQTGLLAVVVLIVGALWAFTFVHAAKGSIESLAAAVGTMAVAGAACAALHREEPLVVKGNRPNRRC
jgi:hypothetical protein